VSLTLPITPFATTIMELTGAAIAALLIAAPLVFGARQQANCDGIAVRERRMAAPEQTKRKRVAASIQRSAWLENRIKPEHWN